MVRWRMNILNWTIVTRGRDRVSISTNAVSKPAQRGGVGQYTC